MASDAGWFSTDTGIKLALLFIGAILGLVGTILVERWRAKREPNLRLSYDLKVGNSMANVPERLAERVRVRYSDREIDGQLFEATCKVVNTGNRVVKSQYMRFSFPEGSTILDGFLVDDIPPEYAVTDAPLEGSKSGDRRWRIGHLEKGASVTFGMLVSASSPARPEVFPHNESGDVRVTAGTLVAEEDDAAQIAPFVTWLLANIFVPPLVGAFEGSFLPAELMEFLTRVVLFIPLLSRAKPVGRVLQARFLRRMTSPDSSTGLTISNFSGQMNIRNKYARPAVPRIPSDRAAVVRLQAKKPATASTRRQAVRIGYRIASDNIKE